MRNNSSIAIAFTAPIYRVKALALAQKLALPVVDINDHLYQWLLVYTDDHLEIRQLAENSPGPIYIDFLAGKLAYRRTYSFIKNELIAKAVGVTGTIKPTVIDATAGLGRDAFILASLGCQVTMLERSAIIAALLEDGLQRLFAHENNAQALSLSLINIDAINYLSPLSAAQYPDVIYLDPMYPQRQKTALVKKEMRLLQNLVDDNADAADLLECALKYAKKRVVVKRPRLAETLNNRKPDFAQIGKEHRFDVYLIRTHENSAS